jgi:hypothetical protein
MRSVTNCSALLATVFLIASCSASSTTSSSSAASSHTDTTPRSSGSSQVSAGPTTFTSATYRYTLTVPARWTSRQASEKWDIQSELDGTSILADLFGEPSESRGVFAAAARWKRDLAAYTTYLIAWNAHYHEFCPQRPNTRTPVTIGGRPGVLLAYNCGILVNIAATVHRRVGYLFTFVDQGVAAATDPTDHATFLKVLRSVQFPD